MAQDDQLVLELVGAGQDIVQVHVTVFVNLFFAMIWTEERHFRNQYLRFVHVTVAVQSGR